MVRIVVSIAALSTALVLISTDVSAQGIPGIPTVVQNVLDRQVERVQEQVVEQTITRAQNQVADQAVEQAVQQTVQQTQNRTINQADALQSQTLERVQSQAGRIQEQALDRVQNQAERVQTQTDRLQSHASELTQARIQQLQDVPGRIATNPAEINGLENRSLPAAVIGRALFAQNQNQDQDQDQDQGAGTDLISVLSDVSEIAPPVYPSPLAQLPERLPINDTDGNEAFVEIRIQPNIRILEREWVMLINADQRQVLINQAPVLMEFLQETTPFEALNSFIIKFRVPPDLDSEAAVLELLPESLHNLIDRNHVYSAQSEAPPKVASLSLPMMSVCNRRLSVGMIDSAVMADHPAFAPGGRSTPLVTRAFIDRNLIQPSGHGTAVAGIMVGHTQGLQPLLPNATLYSASVVYTQDAYNQGATVLNLMQALDWLISIDELQVINISMTGPPNRLLELGVRAAQRRGKVIVAAAGNEGPFAPALYPAAYDGVITATAVAVDTSIYRWANQGDHVDFAALGVSVVTARGDGTVGAESGTSMAAPTVSAFFACEMAAQNGDIARALDRLRARAIDLGAQGRDPVFGHGLLHP
ncbi:MAG: S8 family serine peptidase [Pseudohongiella sp.]|nr:S8 family serine peptidase [Pseudohongiella sp.]